MKNILILFMIFSATLAKANTLEFEREDPVKILKDHFESANDDIFEDDIRENNSQQCTWWTGRSFEPVTLAFAIAVKRGGKDNGPLFPGAPDQLKRYLMFDRMANLSPFFDGIKYSATKKELKTTLDIPDIGVTTLTVKIARDGLIFFKTDRQGYKATGVNGSTYGYCWTKLR